MLKYILETIDWSVVGWFVAGCFPLFLALVFLAVHIADIMDDRRIRRTYARKITPSRPGWDSPKTKFIHYIKEVN